MSRKPPRIYDVEPGGFPDSPEKEPGAPSEPCQYTQEKVIWDGRTIVMFAEDIELRGEEIAKDASA